MERSFLYIRVLIDTRDARYINVNGKSEDL